ncbi:MAG: glycosyltransferase family 4 protein [Conexibacter sp.]|nr:glycosyltransferase family 4 protein [Conexibacter sp.]
MRVAFVLQDLQLSGGVGVAVEHAVQLRRDHGIDARIVLTRAEDHPRWRYRGLDTVPVHDFASALAMDWDVGIATWWQTTSSLFHLQAGRYVYFIQALEDSAYPAGAPERVAAALTTALPVRFVTEARWIADIVEDLQPGTRALYVRNGIPKDVFAGPAAPPVAPEGAPLRVVIEGSSGLALKGVDDALAAVAAMREPAYVTWVSPNAEAMPEGVDRVVGRLSHPEMAELYADHHVILKLSRAEGMYGPPLEAFHMGATVVTTAVTGHDEYVRHGVNGLVVGWDDVPGTARALDLLARDRRLLHELRGGALRTARAWPDWRQSSQVMALALRQVVAEPPPPARGAGLRLASEFAVVQAESELAAKRIEIGIAEQLELRGEAAYIYGVRVRRQFHRARGVAARFGRPVKRLLRR